MNLLSNRKYIGLLLFLFTSGISFAQTSELRVKLKVSSLDDKREIVLNASGELEEVYDGYIVFPNFMDRIQGEIKEGGFNFLDYTGMGTLFESKRHREQLAKNKFPLGDLEVFSNGFDADKVLSFRIIPEFVNENDDTVSLFIKYILYDFDNNQIDYFNWNAKIKLYNKLIRVPLNKEVSLPFINDALKEYKFRIELSKIDVGKNVVIVKNKNLFDSIKSKKNKYELINKDIKLDLTFAKSTKLTDPMLYSGIIFAPKGETESNITFVDAEKFDGVEFNSNHVNLRNGIYSIQLNVPFQIYNKEKIRNYQNYKTITEIFKSTYNFYFVPISIENDSLIADIYITIKKINLGDGIARWTPIHKRVKMKINKYITNDINTNKYNASFMFKLPEENWSAFFSREGENYEIYGYSDYERFIDEFINITVSLEGNEK